MMAEAKATGRSPKPEGRSRRPKAEAQPEAAADVAAEVDATLFETLVG
jgi:hypothetical protein